MTLSAQFRTLAIAAALGLAGLALLVPSPGEAWWRGGVFIGIPPIVVPPLGYPYPYPYPPPVYAPPIYPAPPADGPPPGYEQGPKAYQSLPAGEQPRPGYEPAPAGAPQPAPAKREQAGTPGYSCFAGAYVCPLDRSLPVGTRCSCPSNRGGRVAGQAG
ncbi:MAG: hypothetical protein JO047_01580 [Alphaproteobacteria bacterium]|nr:hypothetical protein [Alphaproteobacteria bacterium]